MTTRLLGSVLTAVIAVVSWIAPVAVAQAQTGCTSVACVSAGPRLASVDTRQSLLLDTLLQALLPGTSVQVGVVDWNGLAAADLNLNLLITELGAEVGVSDPTQVLATDISLGQFKAAMIRVAQADGNTALVNLLQALPIGVGPLNGTIKLGDLLKLDLPPGALANIDLDLLDLITGVVQLYNYKNVINTPQPISIDTGALGLAGLANVSVWLRVVEPPVYVCGDVGTSFYSAAVRTKLNVDVLDSNFSLQPVLNAIGTLSLGLVDVDLSQDLLHVQLYADIARAQGTIAAIDALANAVTINAQPGLVNLYVGEIADSKFFSSTPIADTDLTSTHLSKLHLSFKVGIDLGLINLSVLGVNVDLAVKARALANGSSISGQSVSVSGPWPQTRTVSAGTVVISNLVGSLLNTLDIDVASENLSLSILGLPAITLNWLINSVLNPIVSIVEVTLQGLSNALLQPILTLLLGGLIDPLLNLLGIHVGEMVFTVDGVSQQCAPVLVLEKALSPSTAPGAFNLSIAQAGTSLASVIDVGHEGKTSPIVTTPGLTYAMAESAGTGANLSSYASSWSCTDQNSTVVASGSGSNFDFIAPPFANAPLNITCRITNRLLQSDLSISKSDGADTYTPGGSATYELIVVNHGPDGVTGAQISDQLPNGVRLSGPWTCSATAGSCSAASGGGAGDNAISLSVDLPVDGQATVSIPVVFDTSPAAYQ